MDWDNVKFDVYILGKVLGGGVFLIFVVLVDKEVLDVFIFGLYGLIFGGNLFVCVVLIVVLDVIVDEDLLGCFLELGDYFKE